MTETNCEHDAGIGFYCRRCGTQIVERKKPLPETTEGKMERYLREERQRLRSAHSFAGFFSDPMSFFK